MKQLFILFFTISWLWSLGQYAPAAGVVGTSAIDQDSNIIVGWAKQAVVIRGWINMADTTLGRATIGNAQSSVGKADNNVVSLGDAGFATLSFEYPITNGPGWDFVVFENSFDGHFLELAFVEVSSDGQNFFRFPAHSLTQDSVQISAFGNIDPTKINNLAGKYKVGYGTPFDLSELDSVQGLDINNIQKVRIIDVVGSINPLYATYDTAGNRINDPWPMSFASSGFDLDAVGVIHQTLGFHKKNRIVDLKIFPNPVSNTVFLKLQGQEQIVSVRVNNLAGICIFNSNPSNSMDVSTWKAGIYIFRVETSSGRVIRKKISVIKP